MNLSSDLAWRGLIKDKTFADASWLDKPQAFYHGYDASAPSLTIGNLAGLILDKRFIDAGWQAVILMGGGTSQVGDPGGKTEERQLKSREEIKRNIAGIRQQTTKLFQGEDYTMLDNADWLEDLKYLDFLRDIGKNFSMTELMQREFVSQRMGETGSGISYAEFSYSLLQGYDFWWLFKHHGVKLQVGSSDQWGNMLSGVPLIRKKEGQIAHAMSTPLVIDKTTGRKFGKSEEGAIWLDPAETSPTQFYQFWINVDDADVENYLKVFTFLSKEKIEQVVKQHQDSPDMRLAQKLLAEEVTKLVHGEDQSGSATGVTKYLTGRASIAEASDEDLAGIRKEIPAIKSEATGSVVEALVKTGLASSNSDARRLLSSGAIYINGSPAKRQLFRKSNFDAGKLLLRRGKAYRDSALVELE